MVKLSIIIDLSYLLYKDVFILKKLKRVKQDLKDLLLKDYEKISKSFHYNNMYCVSDSNGGNWRKSEYKNYKGKRVKDETIDWEFVYKIFDEFKNEIKNKRNVKFLEMSGLEGDDFIAHIVKELNKKSETVIPVSGLHTSSHKRSD